MEKAKIMKLKDKEKEIEEMFLGIPEFQRIFKQYERFLRYYNIYNWNEHTTKEKLEKKRDDLLALAQGLGPMDLTILYYVRNIRGLGQYRMIKLLRKLYTAERAFEKSLNHEEDCDDFFWVGGFSYKKVGKGENSQKNP